MDTVRATVEAVGDRRVIRIDGPGEAISIPLSEDNATAVKSAFNRLIVRIKSGAFQITLEKGDDLFSQVASE